MNKKALILALSLAMLTGCGGETDKTPEAETKEEVKQEETVKESEETTSETESNLIGGEEKGDGNITLATPGGEGKDVSLILDKDTVLTQIGINAENVDVDGNEPTYVYIDGKENKKLQLSKDVMHQGSLDLEGDLLKEGKHNVEVIQEKDGEQVFYRLLTYEVK